MSRRRTVERFVEDEIRRLQRGLDVAVHELARVLAERQLPFFRGVEHLLRPLELGHLRAATAAARSAATAAAFGAATLCPAAFATAPRALAGSRRLRASGRAARSSPTARRACLRRRRLAARAARRRCWCRAAPPPVRRCAAGAAAGAAGAAPGAACAPPRARRGSCRRARRCAAARAGRCRSRCTPRVALQPRVRTARPETDQRIDDKRQRLELDPDCLDRFGRGVFVDGGDRQNRLALVDRLVRQRPLALGRGDDALAEELACLRSRKIVWQENRLHAGHRQRRAGVDAHDAGVRHRAQKQLREEHPLGAMILGVLRLPRDLGDEIRCRVVLSDEFGGHVLSLSASVRRRASSP